MDDGFSASLSTDVESSDHQRLSTGRKRYTRRTTHSRRKAWIHRLLAGEITSKTLAQYEEKEKKREEALALVSKANTLYVQGTAHYKEAVALLRKAIALHPTGESFGLLADIYDSIPEGRCFRKATELYMLQAHIHRSNADFWKKVHTRYMEQGQFEEAAYCLKRAAATYRTINPNEAGRLLKAKADIHLDHGHPTKKITSSLEHLLRLNISDENLREEALLLLAETLHKREKSEDAIAVLQEHIRKFDPRGPSAKYPVRTASMLCEISMEKGMFKETIALIDSIIALSFRCPVTDLPLDFLSKYAICLLYLDRGEEAERYSQHIMNRFPPHPQCEYPEAHYDMATHFIIVGDYGRALQILQRLLGHETLDQANLRYQMGRCYHNMGPTHNGTAIEHLEAATHLRGHHVGAQLTLSRVRRSMGDNEGALAALRCNEPHNLRLEDDISLNVELVRTLIHCKRPEEAWAAAQPILQALLRDPPPRTAATTRSHQTELTMQSSMSRLISSQFVLTRQDLLPHDAYSDVLSQSARSAMTTTSSISSRPVLDTTPTVFSSRAKGIRKRKRKIGVEFRDDAVRPKLDGENDRRSVGSRGTAMSDLDDMEGDGEVYSDGEGSVEGGGIDSAASDIEGSGAVVVAGGVLGDGVSSSSAGIPPPPAMPVNEPYFQLQMNRGKWNWSTVNKVLPDDELFLFLKSVMQTRAETGQYAAASQYLFELLAVLPSGDYRFRGCLTEYTLRIKQILLGYVFLSGDYSQAYGVVRGLIAGNSTHNTLWNVFAHIIHKSNYLKLCGSALTRMAKANPSLYAPLLFVGHYHLSLGFSKVALRFYMEAFRQVPNDPLVLLCCAVAYCTNIMNRKIANRHDQAMHAMAFFDLYSRTNRPEEEIYYNLARGYHQIGLVHLAVPYYWKVLELAQQHLQRTRQQPQGEVEKGEGSGDSSAGTGTGTGHVSSASASSGSSLRREAAFNLHKIYLASGNRTMAAQVLFQHCRF